MRRSRQDFGLRWPHLTNRRPHCTIWSSPIQSMWNRYSEAMATVAISGVNAQSLLGYLKTFGFASIYTACKSTHVWSCDAHTYINICMCTSWNRGTETGKINRHPLPSSLFSRYFQDFHNIHRDSTTQPSPTCSFNGIGFAGADRGGGLASILQQGEWWWMANDVRRKIWNKLKRDEVHVPVYMI